MVIHSNRPGAGATARGATQEGALPMPAERTRFTIFAVSRDNEPGTFTSDDGIPWAHVHDEAAALSRIVVMATEGFSRPTRVVERSRAYPFETIRVVWRCDE